MTDAPAEGTTVGIGPIDDDVFRQRARAAAADLAPAERQLVLDVVEEWLSDHPGASQPEPSELVATIRDELELPSSTVTSASAWRTRRRLTVAVLVVLVVALIAGLHSWATYSAPPQAVGGGWRSEDLKSVTVQGLYDQSTVFRCAPGTLRGYLDFISDDRFPVELEAVSVPLLDEAWSDLGFARRTRTQAMRDPYGSIDDLVDFDGARLERNNGFARLRLEWSITECVPMGGLTTIDSVEVTYRVLGVTRHDRVSILQPLVLTTEDLDQVPG